MNKRYVLLALGTVLAMSAYGQDAANLELGRPLACKPRAETCSGFDAIVFVHGIYGGEATFVNPETGFNWPRQLPMAIGGRTIDVYTLQYQSQMLSWARGSNPDFVAVANSMYEALAPVRKRQYRSIGFVAHSLGGNFVSTYLHQVKTKRGHPARSQHAYVITLATPILGAQIADQGSFLKSLLGMNDGLLQSLSKENLYLRMLTEFREGEGGKAAMYGCRPVHLHAAYEEKELGPVLVVPQDSAVEPISKVVASPVVGFKLDHTRIAKPSSASHEVFLWVNDRVTTELARLDQWEASRKSKPANHKLCDVVPFIQEP